MDWNAPVDLYCERNGTAFWAEPLNAFSNGAFIIAALVGLYFALRHKRLTPANALLILFAASVGIGSFLFHTFANEWSSWADQIPIALLVLCYIALALRIFLQLSWPRTLLIMLIYFVVSAGLIYVLASKMIVDLSWTKGSHLYAPVIFGYIALGATLSLAHHKVAPLIWSAGAFFVLAITFRSLDHSLCSSFPHGTHYFWHTFNGIMIAILLAAMVLHGKNANADA